MFSPVDFDERHNMSGVEIVCTNDAVCRPHVFRQRGNRDAAGIAGQYDVRITTVKPSEELLLIRQHFRNRFHNEVTCFDSFG